MYSRGIPAHGREGAEFFATTANSFALTVVQDTPMVVMLCPRDVERLSVEDSTPEEFSLRQEKA